MKRERIAVIGAGKLGKAIGALIGADRVRFWDVDPKKSGKETFDEVLRGSDILFFCVPSWALPDVFSAAKPHLGRAAIAVCVSKGLEEQSGLAVDALFRRHFSPAHAFVFLGGAMLSAELVSGKGGVALAASASPASARRVAALFKGTGLQVGRTTDVQGVVMAGVLKNVYAMGLGMADGLGWGSDMKGWLAAASVREMADLLPRFGGRRETAFGPAGLADLLATGFSHHSTHRQAGEGAVTNRKAVGRCEGVLSLPVLARRIGSSRGRFPLLTVLAAIMAGKKRPTSLERTLRTMP